MTPGGLPAQPSTPQVRGAAAEGEGKKDRQSNIIVALIAFSGVLIAAIFGVGSSLGTSYLTSKTNASQARANFERSQIQDAYSKYLTALTQYETAIVQGYLDADAAAVATKIGGQSKFSVTFDQYITQGGLAAYRKDCMEKEQALSLAGSQLVLVGSATVVEETKSINDQLDNVHNKADLAIQRSYQEVLDFSNTDIFKSLNTSFADESKSLVVSARADLAGY